MSTFITERETPGKASVSAQITPRIYETDPTRQQYAWQPKGLPTEVRVDVEVMERLERESLEIFRAITSRGSEIGGILLGHVLPGSPRTVIVEDFEPVVCAHNRGPLYLLAEEEQQALRETIAKRNETTGPAVVGFFRSNTRSFLGMQDDDVALFDDLFPEEHNVFLMAKPFSRKPCQGSIFVREAKGMKTEASYLDFPFSKAELEKREELVPAIRVPSQPVKPVQAKISVRVQEMTEPVAAKPAKQAVKAKSPALYSLFASPENDPESGPVDLSKLEGLFHRAAHWADGPEEQASAVAPAFSFGIETEKRSKLGWLIPLGVAVVVGTVLYVVLH